MSIEKTYSQNVSLKHRKEFAQFFTPEPIAQLMAKWVLGNSMCKTVLEPAFGLGIFSRILLNNNPDLIINSFEIDPIILDVAKKSFAEFLNLSLNLGNYMFKDWENKYDGIICNPPYFKFHDYDNKSVLKEIQKHLNISLSGFTNLYALFILKSVYQLSEGGRMAYIVPSEFLNSDYGVLVKSHLLKTGALKHLFIFDFEENVFDDALTTASILLFSKDNLQTSIQFSTINKISELNLIDKYISNYPGTKGEFIYNPEEILTSVKWRQYYQVQNAEKYKNLVPFSNYAKVMRGIATGANDYFTFNKEKANTYSIPRENLLPCICKSKDVKKSIFTKDDFVELVESNETVYLFNGIGTKDGNVLNFIVQGEKDKINERYLTKKRKPWYALENRAPAPIWVSVFNRNGLKFVRNEANVSNLTTFHCVYLKQDNLFDSVHIDVLFAYLLTPTAHEIFNDNRREYGDGLKKFEPNDLNKAKMVNLSLLTESENDEILKLYYLFKKEEQCHYIDRIDTIIKNRFKLDAVRKIDGFKKGNRKKTNAQQTVLQESGFSFPFKDFF